MCGSFYRLGHAHVSVSFGKSAVRKGIFSQRGRVGKTALPSPQGSILSQYPMRVNDGQAAAQAADNLGLLAIHTLDQNGMSVLSPGLESGKESPSGGNISSRASNSSMSWRGRVVRYTPRPLPIDVRRYAHAGFCASSTGGIALDSCAEQCHYRLPTAPGCGSSGDKPVHLFRDGHTPCTSAGHGHGPRIFHLPASCRTTNSNVRFGDFVTWPTILPFPVQPVKKPYRCWSSSSGGSPGNVYRSGNYLSSSISRLSTNSACTSSSCANRRSRSYSAIRASSSIICACRRPGPVGAENRSRDRQQTRISGYRILHTPLANVSDSAKCQIVCRRTLTSRENPVWAGGRRRTLSRVSFVCHANPNGKRSAAPSVLAEPPRRGTSEQHPADAPLWERGFGCCF